MEPAILTIYEYHEHSKHEERAKAHLGPFPSHQRTSRHHGNTGDGSEFHSLAVRIMRENANRFVRNKKLEVIT